VVKQASIDQKRVEFIKQFEVENKLQDQEVTVWSLGFKKDRTICPEKPYLGTRLGKSKYCTSTWKKKRSKHNRKFGKGIKNLAGGKCEFLRIYIEQGSLQAKEKYESK
jgi:hypothetical protein